MTLLAHQLSAAGTGLRGDTRGTTRETRSVRRVGRRPLVTGPPSWTRPQVAALVDGAVWLGVVEPGRRLSGRPTLFGADGAPQDVRLDVVATALGAGVAAIVDLRWDGRSPGRPLTDLRRVARDAFAADRVLAATPRAQAAVRVGAPIPAAVLRARDRQHRLLVDRVLRTRVLRS